MRNTIECEECGLVIPYVESLNELKDAPKGTHLAVEWTDDQGYMVIDVQCPECEIGVRIFNG
jgi:hypothetical protein